VVFYLSITHHAHRHQQHNVPSQYLNASMFKKKAELRENERMSNNVNNNDENENSRTMERELRIQN
jgi:hypothetical protein